MIATGIIAGLMLIGIIFMYYYHGTLNIDFLLIEKPLLFEGAMIASFLVLVAVIFRIETLSCKWLGA
jgi:formate hydrogenlyase subunit 3/multisubunit Na+/H+ antiporter MnhD subunit